MVVMGVLIMVTVLIDSKKLLTLRIKFESDQKKQRY